MTLQIQESGDDIIILNSESNWLSNTEQREVLMWFKEHRMEMLREILCEDCPEVC